LPKEIREAAQGFVPKKWPLLLFLHGAGETGPKFERLMKPGMIPTILETEPNFPFITVSPQCINGWNPKPLKNIMDEICKEFPVDQSRIYGTGLSMGGGGLWAMALAYPDLFTAIAPICGYGDSKKAQELLNISHWVFHNIGDEIVPIESSDNMVNSLREANHPNVKYTVYPFYRFREPYLTHDSWTETYNNPDLYKWFLSFTKDGETDDEESRKFFLSKIDSLKLSGLVRVQFTVKFKNKKDAERVALIGDIPQLGHNDTKKAVPMYFNHGNVWSIEKLLSRSEVKQFHYKYLVFDETGSVIKESERYFLDLEKANPLTLKETKM